MMEISKTDFKVLEALDIHEIETQRQLAECSGLSLGQVNYVLKSLLKKGLVKIGKFRKNPNKIHYAYLLTPKGIETKSKLAVEFVIARLNEYHQLNSRLENRLRFVEEKGFTRVFYVGPDVVYDLLETIVNEKRIQITLVGNGPNWKYLKRYALDSYDIALIFDRTIKDFKSLSKETGVSQNRLMPLL